MNVKYGIKVPKTIRESKKLDDEAGNTMWQDATDLEMNTIIPAFDLSGGDNILQGYLEATGHVVFDVKMDFTWKSRFVKNIHFNPDPIDYSFSWVCSRDSIRIVFTYAALNGLDIYAIDIK